jgi:ribonuclease P/MRP protein subunit POP5
MTADLRIAVNYYSPATSTAIIRCPHAHYQMVWAALTYMTKLPRPIDTPVVVKVVRVSGTIKKAEMEVIKRAKDIILRAKIEQRGGAGARMGMVGHIVKTVEKRKEEVLVQVDEGGDEDEDDSE